jgi:hypothetical protein
MIRESTYYFPNIFHSGAETRFPHRLGRDRTPTLPAVFNIPTPRVAWKVRPDSLLEEDGFELPYADAVNLVVALPVVHVRGRG